MSSLFHSYNPITNNFYNTNSFSSSSSLTIPWSKITPIVEVMVDALKNTHKQQVIYFLDWYTQMQGSLLPITNPTMVQWFKKGFTPLRSIMDILIKQIQRIENQLETLLKTTIKRYDLVQEYQKQKRIYRDIIDLLLDCKENLSLWILKIYDTLSSLYPNESTFINAKEYFQNICIQNRFELLKIK